MKNQRWIPCEEEMPKNGEDVLIWYSYFRGLNYNARYKTFGVAHHWHGVWEGNIKTRELIVYAWMPLPEPFEGAEE